METPEHLTEPAYITGRDGRRYPSRADFYAGRNELIRSLRTRGMSVRAIAAEAGCSTGTVSRVLQAARDAA